MARIVFIVTVFFVLDFSAHAQLRIEAIAGPNISGVWGDDLFADPYYPKLSFTTGVGAAYYLRREGRFVQAQLLYERKGMRINTGYYRFIDGSDPALESNTMTNIRWNYLTLPLMYGFEKGSRVRWTFAAGPYVGVLLSSAWVFNGEKYRTGYNDFDFGLSGSISVLIPIGARTDLKFGVQDNFGLSNIDGENTLRNNSVSLQVGYSYKLKD